jgi:hypothetical protein
MKRIISSYSILILTAVCLLSSCFEKPERPDQENAIITSEQDIDISYLGRYYNITVQLNSQDLNYNEFLATTDCSWIKLEADTVSRNGRLTFYVDPNDNTRSREGVINIQLRNPSPSRQINAQVTVNQRSLSQEDSNSLPDDSIGRKARVGFGYDMTMDYMDPKSVTEPILDYDKLLQAELKWGTVISQEGRAMQSLDLHSSYSVEEMSMWMSKQTTTEVKFLFCNKSVTKFESTHEYDLSQQSFGYSSLTKVVATRYLDEGKVQSIIREGQDIFTNAFRDLYDQVNDNPTRENVKKLVSKYGTHMVIYSDLGGRLDYSVNFKSEETSKEEINRYMKYKNGDAQESWENKETSHSICNTKDGLHFDIYGGTDEAVSSLIKHPNTKDPYSQIDEVELGNWLKSIDPDNPQSVSLVRCLLQPIWQLFTNEKARTEIINHILEIAYYEAGNVGERLQELSLDNYYRFTVTDEMESFSESPDSTFAKVVYYDKLPKVEICHEYVPELRSDRRINIYYPIFRNRTNIRRGIFIGDGDNPPSEVTFDKAGGCYIRPLDGFHPGDIITTLYYIDGAFYSNSLGINIPDYKMEVRNEWVRIPLHDPYPIVKIGPGFWVRRNADKELGFGERYSITDWHYQEVVLRNVLYANIFDPRNPLAYKCYDLGSEEAQIGTIPDGIWYLPTQKDLDALIKYVGNNPKSLFKHQQTGFEATFDGCMMYHDFISGKELDDRILCYRGEKCFIPFKNTRDDKTTGGSALMLSTDYSVEICPIDKEYKNWYPVRLYRNSGYTHPQLEQ